MMDIAVRETLCTRCNHLKVCKYVEDMEMARVQVDKLRVDTVDPITITVSCNMYHQNNGNTRWLDNRCNSAYFKTYLSHTTSNK